MRGVSLDLTRELNIETFLVEYELLSVSYENVKSFALAILVDEDLIYLEFFLIVGKLHGSDELWGFL